MKNNRRKGITMVEVVVALAMIMVVSASTLTVVMTSINVEENAVQSIALKNDATGVLNCFRYAESNEEFLNVLQKLGPYEYNNATGEYTCRLKGLLVLVRADFENNRLEYTAVNKEDESEIVYRYTYPREEGDGIE